MNETTKGTSPPLFPPITRFVRGRGQSDHKNQKRPQPAGVMEEGVVGGDGEGGRERGNKCVRRVCARGVGGWSCVEKCVSLSGPFGSGSDCLAERKARKRERQKDRPTNRKQSNKQDKRTRGERGKGRGEGEGKPFQSLEERGKRIE